MPRWTRLLIASLAAFAALIMLGADTFAATTPVYKATQTFGGPTFETTSDIAVTTSSIYTAGLFGTSSTNFNPQGSDVIATVGNSYDGYLTKRSIDGTYLWTKTFGSTSTERLRDIEVDANGNVYISGLFGGTIDFDSGPGVANRTSIANQSGFILKLDSDGNFLWVKMIGAISGAANVTDALSLTISGTGVFVTGSFVGTVNFNPDGVDNRTAAGGNQDFFFSRWSTDGTYGWTKVVGNNNISEGTWIDSYNGNLYISGWFAAPSTPINFNPDGSSTSTSAAYDAFITSWTDTGTYRWTRTIRGTGNEYGATVHANASGVYLGGNFTGTNANFNSTGSDLFTSAGDDDAFITKYSEAGVYQWGRGWGSTAYDSVGHVTSDANGIYVAGGFTGTVDFNTTASTDARTHNGGGDAYVARYGVDGTYRWVKAIGSTAGDFIGSVGIGTEGRFYPFGYYSGSTNFNPDGSDIQPWGGSSDVFYSTWIDVYPSTPTDLAATSTSPSSVTLTWSPVATSTSYSVYRATSPGGPVTLATTTASTSTVSFIDTGLTASTTYYYSILSTLEGVPSPTSTEVMVTVDAIPPGRTNGAPTGVLPYGTTAIDLTLTTDVDATCRYATSSGVAYGSMTPFTTTGATNHTQSLTGLTDTTSYSYYVRCQDTFGTNNDDDYAITFSVGADTDAPTITSVAADVTGTSTTITWLTNEAADSQVIYGITQAYGATSTLDTSLVTNHTVILTGLDTGAAYFYRVLSTDAEGNASSSAEFTFATDATLDDDDTPRRRRTSTMRRQANLARLRSEGLLPPVAPSPMVNSSTTSETALFTRDLEVGSTGSDVRELQRLLNRLGFTVALTGSGSANNETDFFGTATRAALALFQMDREITPAVGYFGPLTRAAVSGL